MFYGWIIAGAGFVISFMGIGTRYCFGVFLKSIETEFTISRGAASGFFSEDSFGGLLCRCGNAPQGPAEAVPRVLRSSIAVSEFSG